MYETIKIKLINSGHPAAWIVMLLSVGLMFIVSVYGCRDDCAVEDTRCVGDRVFVCNSETDWEIEANCADIEDFGLGYEWTCCVDPEDGIHSCLPKNECDGGV